MSDHDHDRDHDLAESDDERRITSAMAAFGAQVRPDPGAWDQIDARLDDRAERSARGRRPLLVAAAAVVLLVVAGAVVARARSTGGELQVATTPTSETLSIVAVDTDGRLVELDEHGAQQRVIYQPDSATGGERSPLTGPIAASPADGKIYAERSSPDECENTAESYPVGQIVAISFEDGATEVVAPAGADPAVLPGRQWLAYVTSPDRQPCTTLDDAPVVEVVDLRTGAHGGYTASALLSGDGPNVDAAAVGAAGTSPPPAAAVLDVGWDADDGSLLVLIQPPLRAVPPSVQRLSFDDTLGVVAVAETADLGGFLPSGPVPAGSSLYADSIEPLPGAGRFAVGGRVREHIVYPDGTDAFASENVLEVFDTTMSSADGAPIGTGIALHLDAATTGLTPLTLAGLSSDSSGRLLVSVFGVSAAGGNRLLLWDGNSLSVLGSEYRSAVWIRVVNGEPVTPTTVVAAPGTSVPSTVTAIGTVPTAAPGATLAPLPSLPAAEVPSLVAERTGRPDDANAVIGAYRDFFEQGDRSALEGSGALEPALQAGAESVPGGGKGVTVTVTAIRFTGTESADVDFELTKEGIAVTAPATGSALLTDGRWKVSAATMCNLLSRVGIECTP